ncbi:LacI family DNA-binding transcriptional regulator [Algicella marina]|uniref:Substrate-binding domain-containing protein n=1 Tax=Algicella marina TaxID=2683284 RepID=A0A6P1SXH7_9RHOB|nr:LacI family DNA-binding transcriptional regulator [Algicella marina]QHQ34360.1 substrate-binding domain-containing protein [Algicella marina]
MDSQKIRTMEEFAALSGISRPTVSKYFNDPSSVRDSTRSRIERALEQYDYRPNIFAINQNRKLTKTIGILVPYLADPFFAEIVRNIEWRCIEAGYLPILFSSHGEQDLEVNALETLKSLKPAGALLAPLGRASDLEALKKFVDEVPTVIFDSDVEVGETFVGLDNFQSIGLMVEYLCSTGSPPCFLEMPPVNPNARKRRQAYRQTMEKLGLEPQIIHVEQETWDFERVGLTEGKRLIQERLIPSDTVLCSNDRIAIGLLAAAYESGLRVGRGPGCAMRIAGHDDHPWSRFTSPSLTTVAQDYESIARGSFEALFVLMEAGFSSHERNATYFEGKLILRSSA